MRKEEKILVAISCIATIILGFMVIPRLIRSCTHHLYKLYLLNADKDDEFGPEIIYVQDLDEED